MMSDRELRIKYLKAFIALWDVVEENPEKLDFDWEILSRVHDVACEKLGMENMCAGDLLSLQYLEGE